ncbi:MAG: hypothetical protein ACR2H2_17535, partial [Solirubrobacteraceae bacterium]
ADVADTARAGRPGQCALTRAAHAATRAGAGDTTRARAGPAVGGSTGVRDGVWLVPNGNL